MAPIANRLVGRVRAELGTFVAGLRPVPAVAFLVGALALTLYWYYGRGHVFGERLFPLLGPEGLDLLAAPQLPLARCLYWCLSAWVFLVAVPQVAVRLAARRSPDDPVPTLGWGAGDWRLGLGACALFYLVMAAIVAVIVWDGQFQGKYPLCPAARRSLEAFIAYEAALVLYFVAWEYFWRGFLIFSLEKTFGPWVVFVQMLPFVVVHYDKPDLEALSSIAGGLALGWLALRTRSFWYGAFIHAATDVTLDVMMVALVKGLAPPGRP